MFDASGGFRPAIPSTTYTQPATDRTALYDRARKLLRLRSARAALFGEQIFGEPAWDMLLTLYVVHCEGKKVTISSLCLASSSPTTTALRHIATLSDKGLVEREAPPGYKRRVHVVLTERAIAALETLLAIDLG